MNWDVRLNSCEKGKSEEWVEASNEMVRISTNLEKKKSFILDYGELKC